MIHRTLFLILALAVFVEVAAAAQPSRPNIVFILVDDQRNDTLGIAGHPHIKTPNIDRLAREGLRFENMFVNTSICMASRATLFTGLTQTGHGYRLNDPNGSRKVGDALVEKSFPTILRDAGYHTGYFGKNHVEFETDTKTVFNRMFDDWKIIGRNPYFKKMPDGSSRHCDEILGDLSVAFLKERPDESPFMLYMSFNISHAEDKDHRPGVGHFPWPKAENGLYEDIQPLRPKLDERSHYEATPDVLKASLNRSRFYWRWDTQEKYDANMRALYRMITGMDRIIGHVIQELESQGIADNTIIVYTADNGYYMGERGFAGKWSHYDESLRVPLIVFDPQAQSERRGRTPSEMVSNIDLPATILDLADIEAPDLYQGRSLVPILQGETPSDWPDYVYCEHHQYRNVIPGWVGIRHKRYVYARYDRVNPTVEVLHDLEQDPNQLMNFAHDPDYADTLAWLSELTNQSQAKYSLPAAE